MFTYILFVAIGVLSIISIAYMAGFRGLFKRLSEFRSSQSTHWEVDAEELKRSSYPNKTILASIATLLAIFYFSTAYRQVPQQSYGLILDGYGCSLLAVERLRNPGNTKNQGEVIRSHMEVFWGFLLLALGFFLQLFSLLL